MAIGNQKDEPIKSIYPIILRLSSETNLAGQNCILLSGSHLTNQKHLSDISLIITLTHFSSQTKLSHYPAIWKSSEKQLYVSRHMSGRQKTGLCTDLTQWSYLLIIHTIKEHPVLINEWEVLVSSVEPPGSGSRCRKANRINFISGHIWEEKKVVRLSKRRPG